MAITYSELKQMHQAEREIEKIQNTYWIYTGIYIAWLLAWFFVATFVIDQGFTMVLACVAYASFIAIGVGFKPLLRLIPKELELMYQVALLDRQLYR